jgi:hypothetical protein
VHAVVKNADAHSACSELQLRNSVQVSGLCATAALKPTPHLLQIGGSATFKDAWLAACAVGGLACKPLTTADTWLVKLSQECLTQTSSSISFLVAGYRCTKEAAKRLLHWDHGFGQLVLCRKFRAVPQRASCIAHQLKAFDALTLTSACRRSC